MSSVNEDEKDKIFSSKTSEMIELNNAKLDELERELEEVKNQLGAFGEKLKELSKVDPI